MKIYPINEQLEMLMESFVDEETGELVEWWRDPETDMVYQMSEDLMNSMIDKLQMNFDEKVVELRNDYINYSAEAEAIRNEIEKLNDRLKTAKNRADQRKRWIAWLLKGEKFQSGVCKISYRKSEEVKYDDDDPEKFVLWADKHMPSLLKYKSPEPSKTEIKKAIKAGMDVEYAHIESKKNVIIK